MIDAVTISETKFWSISDSQRFKGLFSFGYTEATPLTTLEADAGTSQRPCRESSTLEEPREDSTFLKNATRRPCVPPDTRVSRSCDYWTQLISASRCYARLSIASAATVLTLNAKKPCESYALRNQIVRGPCQACPSVRFDNNP